MVGGVAVPVRPIDCGLPDALSAIERVAIRVPAALGENVIITRQLLLAGSVAPLQPSLVIAKSPALEPEMLAEILVKAALPLFVSVAVAAVLPGEANVSVPGETVASGVVPLPVNVMDWIVAGFP